MIAALRVAGTLLWRHWPALLALYLAGTLARYVTIQLAGFVGAYSAPAGVLLFPLAILSRLVALVAMLLVLRDGMVQLGLLAPIPSERAARRRAFTNALLGGILPFVAFYAAYGYLREDAQDYFARLLEINSGLIADGVLTDAERAGDAAVGELFLGPLTIAMIVVAFSGRWLWKRYRATLPRWLAAIAVYLEVLWVYLSVSLVGDVIRGVSAWVQTRQGIVWLADLREWVGEQLVPIAWVWDGLEWFLGEAGGIVVLPIAWLTIAGVIYGQAVAPQTARLSGGVVSRAQARFTTLPARLRARLTDIWTDLAARVQPIGRALLLMWRAGPVLIGTYILAFTILLWLQSALEVASTRVLGPNDLFKFWMVNEPLIFLFVPLIIEPLRVVLVASAYDRVIGRLALAARPSALPMGLCVCSSCLSHWRHQAGSERSGARHAVESASAARKSSFWLLQAEKGSDDQRTVRTETFLSPGPRIRARARDRMDDHDRPRRRGSIAYGKDPRG